MATAVAHGTGSQPSPQNRTPFVELIQELHPNPTAWARCQGSAAVLGHVSGHTGNNWTTDRHPSCLQVTQRVKNFSSVWFAKHARRALSHVHAWQFCVQADTDSARHVWNPELQLLTVWDIQSIRFNGGKVFAILDVDNDFWPAYVLELARRDVPVGLTIEANSTVPLSGLMLAIPHGKPSEAAAPDAKRAVSMHRVWSSCRHLSCLQIELQLEFADGTSDVIAMRTSIAHDADGPVRVPLAGLHPDHAASVDVRVFASKTWDSTDSLQ
jgi:hypothetical protein